MDDRMYDNQGPHMSSLIIRFIPIYPISRRCRAANLCRELLHGKDFFAVRSKKSVRQRKNARQSMRAAHGKET
jgi:hypothetical protein